MTKMNQKINRETDGWVFGKHALITGASDGIGRELSRNLVGVCKKLTLIARCPDKLQNLKSELNTVQSKLSGEQFLKTEVEVCSLDIRNTEGMVLLTQRIYEENKDTIDVFINCAGGSHVFEVLETMGHSDIEQIFDTNGKAPISWLRELLPRMKNHSIKAGDLKRAHIIMMSSRSGERALPNLTVYAAAKGCIEKLVEGLRTEYARYRIVFTLINPGSVRTSFSANWKNEYQDSHNEESMTVGETIRPIIQALNAQFATNKISFESTEQWLTEPGVLQDKSLEY